MHKKVVLICLLLLFAVLPCLAKEVWRDGDTILYVGDPVAINHEKLADKMWDLDNGPFSGASEKVKKVWREINKDFKANSNRKGKPKVTWVILGIVLAEGDMVAVDRPGALELIVFADGRADTIPDSRIMFTVDVQQTKYGDSKTGPRTLRSSLWQRHFDSMGETVIPIFVRLECSSIQEVMEVRPTRHWRVLRDTR